VGLKGPAIGELKNMAKEGLNSNIYGSDDTDTAESISSEFLGSPDPTLDIHGEKDSRAVSEGNHGKQG
jgi:hypothetical protein